MHDASECEYGPGECRRCAKQARAYAMRRGDVLPFYVVAYGIARIYGGPEEGGWYWDRVVALEVKKCWNWRQGMAAVHDMRERYPKPRYDRYSVLGGEDIVIDAIPTTDFVRENLTSGGYS